MQVMGKYGIKPLGGKVFPKVPHLSFSKLGSGDHFIDANHEKACTQELPKGCRLILQPKSDGACVAAFNDGKNIVALGRAGYLARESEHAHIREFAEYVKYRESDFREVLTPYSYLCSEWIWQRHSVKYKNSDPLIVFDLFQWEKTNSSTSNKMGFEHIRQSYLSQNCILISAYFQTPHPIHFGERAINQKELDVLVRSYNQNPQHGELEPVEGVIYRMEKPDKHWFCAKFVTSTFQPGRFIIKGAKPQYCCDTWWNNE
jgi:hypothetical protein